MGQLCGTVQTVVEREDGVFGLPECTRNSGQPVWYYPFSVIASIISPADTEAAVTGDEELSKLMKPVAGVVVGEWSGHYRHTSGWEAGVRIKLDTVPAVGDSIDIHYIHRRDDGVAEYVVGGAGIAECNGVYTRASDQDGVPSFINGEILMLRYKLPSGSQWWYLADRRSLDRAAGDYYRLQSSSDTPPLSGWQIDGQTSDGRPPLPIVSVASAAQGNYETAEVKEAGFADGKLTHQ